MLREIKACAERSAVGRETWNRLARCAVRCVSDCRWAGKAGRDGCECAPLPGLLRAMMNGLWVETLNVYVCVSLYIWFFAPLSSTEKKTNVNIGYTQARSMQTFGGISEGVVLE